MAVVRESPDQRSADPGIVLDQQQLSHKQEGIRKYGIRVLSHDM
jgi:hypothetical protein